MNPLKAPFLQRLFVLAGLLCFLSATLPAQVKRLPQREPNTWYSHQKITYTLFKNDNGTYGYNIFINKALFIYQPAVPCANGNKGFQSKSDAKKLAALVIEKIRKGQVPPSVTLAEMKKLGIVLN